MTLVLDATVVVSALACADGFSVLDDEDLVAPALMWSEVMDLGPRYRSDCDPVPGFACLGLV